MKALAALGLVTLLALGCEGQKPEGQGQGTSSAASNAAPSSAQAAAQNQVPTEEDFEERVESAITPVNAEQELNKLEKEIGQ